MNRELPQIAQEIQRMLRRLPRPDGDTAHSLDSLEIKTATASLARRIAPILCDRESAAGHGCDWYHSLYPLLRLLDLAAAPERHARFYNAALRRISASHPQVLICGTADHSMLAHVLHAYRSAGKTPQVSIIDLCATPLTLCETYAQLMDLTIQTEVADLLTWTGTTYDALCTHSFLVKFPPDRRADAIARWHALLRPGGVIISAVRIDAELSPATVGFSQERAAAFADLVIRTAADRGVQRESHDTLRAAAERYTNRVASYPFSSRRELVTLLEHSGFYVAHLELVRLGGNVGADQQGAGTNRAATYAEFVAARR